LQVWNDELAHVAQGHAERCVLFLHNSNRVSQQTAFVTVGENIGLYWNEEYFDRAMQVWSAAGMNYNYTSDTCSARECGSYTQVCHPFQLT
jgi:hypothetical protein